MDLLCITSPLPGLFVLLPFIPKQGHCFSQAKEDYGAPLQVTAGEGCGGFGAAGWKSPDPCVTHARELRVCSEHGYTNVVKVHMEKMALKMEVKLP